MSRAETDSPERVATWSALSDREPAHARAEGADLVVVRYDDEVSVLYGRCLHRGVLLGDGHVEGRAVQTARQISAEATGRGRLTPAVPDAGRVPAPGASRGKVGGSIDGNPDPVDDYRYSGSLAFDSTDGPLKVTLHIDG